MILYCCSSLSTLCDDRWNLSRRRFVAAADFLVLVIVEPIVHWHLHCPFALVFAWQSACQNLLVSNSRRQYRGFMAGGIRAIVASVDTSSILRSIFNTIIRSKTCFCRCQPQVCLLLPPTFGPDCRVYSVPSKLHIGIDLATLRQDIFGIEGWTRCWFQFA